jgi:ferredoxin
MTWVVTERCDNCRYTDCVDVCPVDCFYLIDQPHKMVVIDPDTCIDCSLCETTCPVNAIYRDEEVPEPYEFWIERNKVLFKSGTLIKKRQEPLSTAITLQEVQARERERGLIVHEPPPDR